MACGLSQGTFHLPFVLIHCTTWGPATKGQVKPTRKRGWKVSYVCCKAEANNYGLESRNRLASEWDLKREGTGLACPKAAFIQQLLDHSQPGQVHRETWSGPKGSLPKLASGEPSYTSEGGQRHMLCGVALRFQDAFSTLTQEDAYMSSTSNRKSSACETSRTALLEFHQVQELFLLLCGVPRPVLAGSVFISPNADAEQSTDWYVPDSEQIQRW